MTNLIHLGLGKTNQNVNLPFNITSLYINCNNTHFTDYLPDSIEDLELGSDFNLELANLPSSIKK
jgi:hypothetical protein